MAFLITFVVIARSSAPRLSTSACCRPDLANLPRALPMTIADANATADAGEYGVAASLAAEAAATESSPVAPAKMVQWQL